MWSWMAVVVSLVAATNGEFSFQCVQPPNKNGPTIPPLADQYVMTVEVNVVQFQKTIEVVETYDSKSQEVAVELRNKGEIAKTITDFNTQERFYLLPNGTCEVHALSESGNKFNVFGFTAKGKNGKFHIASVSDVFRIGSKYNISYIGQTTIRGIPVDHWGSCQTSDELNATFRLDYYFSRVPYVSADNATSVPIRFEITGQAKNVMKSGVHNFTHVYEFTVYKPGPIKDRSPFQTPRGIVCKGQRSARPLPRIPDQFSMSMEMDSGDGILRNINVYYDYTMKLMMTDVHFAKGSKHKYGAGTVSHIDDFHTGVEYVINRHEKNCTVGSMSHTLERWYDDLNNITMMHPQTMLLLKGRTFLYQGQRTWRGLNVDAWANKTDDKVLEIYFTPKPKTKVKGQPTPAPVIVGVYMTNINTSDKQDGTKGKKESFFNVYNFQEGHPDIDKFEVETCFINGIRKSLNLQFTVEGVYEQHVYGHKSIFLPPLRNALAKSAIVERLRIGGLSVDKSQTKPKLLVISFVVLDLIPMEGNVSSPAPQTSLEQAKLNLVASANNGIKFAVPYPHASKTFIIDGGSLATTTTKSPQNSGGAAYSPGAMAGLGIAMLVFGCIIGLIVAFVIYRRIDTEVPYKREK